MMLKKLLIALFLSLAGFASIYGEAGDQIIVQESLSPEINPTEFINREEGSPGIQKNKNGEVTILTSELNFSSIGVNNQIREKLIKMKNDYEGYAGNDDVKGIIKFGDLLYLPYVYTPDEFEKYLHLNPYEETDNSGTPFLAADFDDFTGNSLMYGHNMRNGTAFGKLDYITDVYTFQNIEPLIIYYALTDSFHIYKPFTVYHIIDGEINEAVQTNSWFGSAAERAEFNKASYEKSIVPMEDGLNPDFTKPALYLQSCVNAEGLERYVMGFTEISEIRWKDIGKDF